MGGMTALQMSCFIEMGSVKNLVLIQGLSVHLSLERFVLVQIRCLK